MMFRSCTAFIALVLVFSAASGASLGSHNNVDDEKIIRDLEVTKSFNIKELAKIGAYLYKISKELPTVCYVKVVVTCKSEKTFENFKACSEGYIAENPDKCKNPSEATELLDVYDNDVSVETFKKINIKELVKIAAYIFKISQELPTVCYAKVIYTCKDEAFFKNFKSCVEGYIAKNPEECENPSEATELLRNPEITRDFKYKELLKIAAYFYKISKEVPTLCYMKLAVHCKNEKIFADFKICADNYLIEHKNQCSSASAVSTDLAKVDEEVSREITEWELVKIVLYIRKMSKTVSTNCFVKLLVNCKASKTYNSFKTCADKYVKENQSSCSSSTQIFFGYE